MSNTKKIKKSLLLSVLSLVICCSMLLGTTFAWFTDSVTSGNNIIKSGNLDVTLEYWDGDSWEDVSGKSNILTNTLWEPGTTEVAYFRIANAGSLALKYQFGINIVSETAGKNVAGETFKLSDYIKFGVVENVNGETGKYATREAAVAAVTNAQKISAGYTKAASMGAGDELYLALVVYMPETVGNEANHNGTDVPQIDLGISIFATQFTTETDSFDNLYDENAWHPEMKVYTADELLDALSNAPAGTVISIENDLEVSGDLVIPAAAPSMARTVAPAILDLNGKTLTADSVSAEEYAIVRNGIIELPDDGYVFASDDTAIALEDVKIVSDGISAYAVRKGSVSLKNVTFVNTATSNPIQNYGGTMVLENVTVAQAGDANTSWYSSAIQTINLIQKNAETNKYEILAQANTTINSGTYTGKKAVMISAPGGNVTINGGTFVGSEFVIQTDFAPNNYTYGSDYTSVITINGGTFSGPIKASTYATVVINGGLFDTDPSAYVADGSYVTETDSGWLVQPKDADKKYPTQYSDLTAGKGENNTYVLAGDVYADDYIMLGNGTENTINLNGYTLTAGNEGQYFLISQSGAKLILNGDGTVDCGKGFYANKENASIEINGGTYLFSATGKLNNIAHHSVAQNNSLIVINDGTFISSVEDACIFFATSNARIEVKGGFFDNTADETPDYFSMGTNKDNTNRIVITGGTFVNWNPLEDRMCYTGEWPANGEAAFGGPWMLIPDGYTVVAETQANGDIWYTVVPVAE